VLKFIAHPTDFSEASALAFAHALRLALASKSKLLLLHVTSSATKHEWSSFPHVRALLSRWGILEANASPHDIASRLGIEVSKVEIRHRDPALGLFEFFLSHRPDLIVLMTHGREGLHRWLSRSVSEQLARQTHVPTLFFGPNAMGFVDTATGELRLERILVPIAHHPSPGLALSLTNDVFGSIGSSPPSIKLFHVGHKPPPLDDMMGVPQVALAEGPVVSTILTFAQENQMQLIAMPTAGHQGFLDVFRGSTTERVLREASCPVLAVGPYKGR
jgi:nucleotide-binding universal stress UspA family protein